jgi:hypothetical protein
MMPPITFQECLRWFVFAGCAAIGWTLGRAILASFCKWLESLWP